MSCTNLKSFFIYEVRYLGEGRYIFLNREYKPLGVTELNKFYDYNDPIYTFWSKGFTEKKVDKLIFTRSDGTRYKPTYDDDGFGVSFHLYNDYTNPLLSAKNMDEYLKRLAILMKVTIYPCSKSQPDFVYKLLNRIKSNQKKRDKELSAL